MHPKRESTDQRHGMCVSLPPDCSYLGARPAQIHGHTAHNIASTQEPLKHVRTHERSRQACWLLLMNVQRPCTLYVYGNLGHFHEASRSEDLRVER
jgi:hypothetical protein